MDKPQEDSRVLKTILLEIYKSKKNIHPQALNKGNITVFHHKQAIVVRAPVAYSYGHKKGN